MAPTTSTGELNSSPRIPFADCSSTGEVPWVYEMINKYHEIAEANGAIVSFYLFCRSLSHVPFSVLSVIFPITVCVLALHHWNHSNFPDGFESTYGLRTRIN